MIMTFGRGTTGRTFRIRLGRLADMVGRVLGSGGLACTLLIRNELVTQPSRLRTGWSACNLSTA